ncbi:MAG: ATP-binding cassette domain-containing protein, partial [Desulfurococcaceae archaeon]
KIIAGILKPTTGKIYLNGEEVRFKSAADAMARGIAMTHQFLDEQLVEIAKVWENFYMGREVTKKIGPLKLLDIFNMRKITKDIISNYHLGFDEIREIRELSGGQRQLVAVTRSIESEHAFKISLKLLLLDEPYTGLSVRVFNEICSNIRKLAQEGVSVIIAAQWFDMIEKVIDEVAVMRLGRIVGRFSKDEVDKHMIYKLAISGA